MALTFEGSLLFAQFFSVFAMTSVVWFVQLVSYPRFLEIGETEFREYHANYGARISMIAGPLMVVELGSALLSVPAFWNHDWKAWMIAGAILTILTWLVTFRIQVPQHSRLSSTGYSEITIQNLVKGNWIRTATWSLHALILLWILRDVLEKRIS